MTVTTSAGGVMQTIELAQSVHHRHQQFSMSPQTSTMALNDAWLGCGSGHWLVTVPRVPTTAFRTNNGRLR